MIHKFEIGDKAYKPKGYKFPCTVVAVFETTSGDVRVVGEMEDNGMLHIFNENQLEHVDNVNTKKANIYDPETFEISKTVDTGVYEDFLDLIKSSLDSSTKYKLAPMTLDMETHEILHGVMMNTGDSTKLKYRIRIERLDPPKE